ncbi:MAG: GFA family protein [Deltaproteobacteria bacterium]|nr:GFA family protein [Deltaproteobacteria bacterium]
MNEWNLPWDAGCRCDQLRMRITEAPIVTMACHCAGCQRMSASAFSLSILVPSSGFAVTQGDPVIGGLHGPSRHFHCAHCKGWAFTRPDGMDGFVNVRATMLDDHAWYAPFVETCRAEGFLWAATGAKHSFPSIPPPEAFGPIVADFQQNGSRPRRS